MVHQDFVKQRGRRLNVTDIEDLESSDLEFVSNDEETPEENNEPLMSSKEYSLLTLRFGCLRDLASAQPLLNTISIMLTDIKKPFKVPGPEFYRRKNKIFTALLLSIQK